MMDAYSVFNYQGRLLKLSSPKKYKIYYKNRIHNLIDDEIKEYDLINIFDHIEIGEKNYLIHFFYELGFIFNNLEFPKWVGENEIMAIEVEYESVSSFDPSYNKSLKLELTNGPKKSDYQDHFETIQKHLKAGNSYQVNYTETFIFKYEQEFEDLLSLYTNYKAPFAHASFFPEINYGILSQSPECLFHWNLKKKTIESMPIKGSLKFDSMEFNKAELQLDTSIKDQAELFMIADLLRNDLNKLGRPSCEVLKKKEFFLVPGILHQYTHLRKKIQNQSLGDVMQALFPGGSITGAPKKRTMEIINEIEKRPRGIYCGSTLLKMNENTIDASINIRTAEVNLEAKKLSYQAGGGITVLSQSEEEYEEMRLKLQSFWHNFR